jgi:hypothetical protein
MLVRDVDLMMLSDRKVFALSLSLALLIAVVLVLWTSSPPWSKEGTYMGIKVSPSISYSRLWPTSVCVDVWSFVSDYRLTVLVRRDGEVRWRWEGTPEKSHLRVSFSTEGWPEGTYVVEVTLSFISTGGGETLADAFVVKTQPLIAGPSGPSR